MDNRHIDPNHLVPKDLEHIMSCDFCADALADYMEGHELLTAPKNMKDSILMRSRQANIQVIAKSNEISKQLQLFYYTLKVGFATVMVFSFLIFAPKLTHISVDPPLRQESTIPESTIHPARRIYKKSQALTRFIQDVSQYITQTEVFSHDK